ncbi:MAG: hypothetical protein ACLTG4_05070 [Oscillospiraceae bacterium]
MARRVGRQVRQLREPGTHTLRVDREPAGRLRHLPQERNGLLAAGLVIAAVIAAALAVGTVVRSKGAAIGVRDAGRDGRIRALLRAGRDVAERIPVDEQCERRADLRALRLGKTLSAGSPMEKQRLYVPSWLTVRARAGFARSRRAGVRHRY